MGLLSRFEGKMEDTVEGAASSLSRSPISPVQISKHCEKQMLRNKMVGAGRQYAPTLYTVLVNPDDDARLFSFYPTLAGEIETYITAKASANGLHIDGHPLVRFIVDDHLRHGKFDVIAEVVASGIIEQLRREEMERYGLAPQQAAGGGYPQNRGGQNAGARGQRPVQRQDQLQDDPFGPGYNDTPAAYDDSPFASSPENVGFGEPVDDPFAPQTVPAAGVAGAAGAAAMGAAGAAAAASAAATQFIPRDNAAQNQQAQPTAALIDETHGCTYNLRGARIVLGRADDCDITIPDINASRRHAEISCQSHGVWVVRDLGSKNGTLVNGEFVEGSCVLYEGDRLTMGLTECTFTMA